ncbi:MAG TPA: alpha-glycosidase [Firmicutes bacterium]|nr:alpha-glycosidase [Bacillota bacterium]
MKKEAIYHKAKSNYAYAYDKETLHLRLRTAKDDIKSVHLYCADPYEWTCVNEGINEWAWNRQAYPVQKEFSTSLYDYWMVEFKPPHKRFKYGFILNDGEQELLFCERGYFEVHDPGIINDSNSYFSFPYMNEEDIFNAPAWVKDTMWYQIFPERFANGNPDLNPENVLPWGSCDPTQETFFGGDLQGIINQLDHLQALGINGLYLTPIFESPTTHKYDTINYYEIDPHFGDKQTFKTLVTQAHERGMKIMLDAVFNHMGDTSPQWQDVIKHGENSRYKDWFFINSFPVVDEGGQAILGSYETFGFATNMPKLNTNNKEVKAYLLDIATYWITEFDIDAWRLDVANEIGHAFWRDFRKAVKAAKPDTYIVGETWHDSTPWLLGDQFDSVMNYPLTKAIIEFVATDTTDEVVFVETLVDALYRYPQNVNEVMFNLLDSHDTVRLLSLANGNKNKVTLCYTMLYSLPGSPCIFYGSEVGIDGEYDPLCRKCMVWDEALQDLDYFNHIQKLIELRKTHDVIGNGGFIEFISFHDKTVAYRKYNDNESIYFYFNNNDSAKSFTLHPQLQSTQVIDLYTANIFEAPSSLKLEPFSFAILKCAK